MRSCAAKPERTTLRLSLRDARRKAHAAQGFAGQRNGNPTAAQFHRVQSRLGLFQFDSVNVLAHARAERGEIGYQALRRFSAEHRSEVQAVLERIRAEGPLAAAYFENGSSKSDWWE